MSTRAQQQHSKVRFQTTQIPPYYFKDSKPLSSQKTSNVNINDQGSLSKPLDVTDQADLDDKDQIKSRFKISVNQNCKTPYIQMRDLRLKPLRTPKSKKAGSPDNEESNSRSRSTSNEQRQKGTAATSRQFFAKRHSLATPQQNNQNSFVATPMSNLPIHMAKQRPQFFRLPSNQRQQNKKNFSPPSTAGQLCQVSSLKRKVEMTAAMKICMGGPPPKTSQKRMENSFYSPRTSENRTPLPELLSPKNSDHQLFNPTSAFGSLHTSRQTAPIEEVWDTSSRFFQSKYSMNKFTDDSIRNPPISLIQNNKPLKVKPTLKPQLDRNLQKTLNQPTTTSTSLSSQKPKTSHFNYLPSPSSKNEHIKNDQHYSKISYSSQKKQLFLARDLEHRTKQQIARNLMAEFPQSANDLWAPSMLNTMPMDKILKVKHKYELFAYRTRQAIKIQRWFRRRIDPLRGKFLFVDMIYYAKVLQRWWKSNRFFRVVRKMVRQREVAAAFIQRNLRLTILKPSERKIFLLNKDLDIVHCKRKKHVEDCQILIAYRYRKYLVRKRAKEALAEKKRKKAALASAKKKKGKKKGKKKKAAEDNQDNDPHEAPIVVDEEEDLELEPDAEMESTARNFESMREHDIEVTVKSEYDPSRLELNQEQEKPSRLSDDESGQGTSRQTNTAVQEGRITLEEPVETMWRVQKELSNIDVTEENIDDQEL